MQPKDSLFKIQIQSFGEEICQRGKSFGPAVRTHYLLHYVLSGEGTFECGGKTHPIKTGQAFLIFPDDLTTYTASEQNPWHYIWVGFSGCGCQSMLERMGFSATDPVLDSLSPEKTQAYLRELSSAYLQENGRDYAMQGNFFLFLSTFREKKHTDTVSGKKNYVDRAVDYLVQNYFYPITVENVAAFVNVNRSTLYRAFQKRFGLSVQEYLLRLRMSAAGEMLVTTDYLVKEICYSCGFSDTQHFIRLFTKMKRLTPTQYRTQYRKLSQNNTSASIQASSSAEYHAHWERDPVDK